MTEQGIAYTGRADDRVMSFVGAMPPPAVAANGRFRTRAGGRR
ncbi:hypothetical protein [Nocardiopsis sp. CNT-189]